MKSAYSAYWSDNLQAKVEVRPQCWVLRQMARAGLSTAPRVNPFNGKLELYSIGPS